MRKFNSLFVSLLLIAGALTTQVAAETIDIPTSGNAALNPQEAQIVKSEENSRARLKGEPLHFDYFYDGDKAVFDLTNKQAQAYTLSLEASSARDGSFLQIIVTDNKGKELTNERIDIANNGWNKYNPYSVEINSLNKGEAKLTLVFCNSNGKGATTNVQNITLTPKK